MEGLIKSILMTKSLIRATLVITPYFLRLNIKLHVYVNSDGIDLHWGVYGYYVERCIV